MKNFILLLSVFVSLWSCTSSDEDTLNYIVKPVEFNDKPALEITMSFVPSDSSATILLFQDKGWGQENLHNLVHNLRIVDGANEIIQKKEKDHYVLEHDSSSERIVISYILLQDTEGDLDTEKAVRPIINDTYFHIYSHNLFMLPKGVIDQSDDAFNVEIEWREFPKTFALQNSFGGGVYGFTGDLDDLANADHYPLVLSLGCSPAKIGPVGPNENYLDTSGVQQNYGYSYPESLAG